MKILIKLLLILLRKKKKKKKKKDIARIFLIVLKVS